MRERAETWLKATCWVLVAVLLFRLGWALIMHGNPFAGVRIPPLPALTATTNAPVTVPPGQPGPGQLPGTNLPSIMAAGKTSTNSPSGDKLSPPLPMALTNAPGSSNMTLTGTSHAGTNLPPMLAAGKAGTNSPSGDQLSPPLPVTLTNASGSSNVLALTDTNHTGTNGPATAGKKKSRSHHSPMMGMGGPGMGSMGGMGGGAPLPELPPVVKSRIDQVVNSELLAPVTHPEPKALMGIAGDVAFLRTDDGQTGMVKVGDSLGDLKLLRIGINRVLIEQNGQKSELTIFNGMGGDSLLTTPDKNSNETTNH